MVAGLRHHGRRSHLRWPPPWLSPVACEAKPPNTRRPATRPAKHD